MARNLVALLLCALAASAAASSIELPVQDVLSGSEVIARDLEIQLEAILTDAEQHRSLAEQHAHLLRGNILTCTVDEFDSVVALAGKVLDVVYKVRSIIKDVPADLKKCHSNWFTVLFCQAKVIKGAFQEVLGLKTEGLSLLGDVKAAVQKYKNCLHPPATPAPATEAPATEAPATEAPATEAPATEAPATEAPATEAPATEAPATEAPATEAPATEAPATGAAPVFRPVHLRSRKSFSLL